MLDILYKYQRMYNIFHAASQNQILKPLRATVSSIAVPTKMFKLHFILFLKKQSRPIFPLRAAGVQKVKVAESGRPFAVTVRRVQ